MHVEVWEEEGGGKAPYPQNLRAQNNQLAQQKDGAEEGEEEEAYRCTLPEMAAHARMQPGHSHSCCLALSLPLLWHHHHMRCADSAPHRIVLGLQSPGTCCPV